MCRFGAAGHAVDLPDGSKFVVSEIYEVDKDKARALQESRAKAATEAAATEARADEAEDELTDPPDAEEASADLADLDG